MSVERAELEQALAVALVDVLARSPMALARIRELVGLDAEPQDDGAPAYTVASLAAALGVSPRTVRGAIARGELAAVKRGGRWIISADAVRAWSADGDAAAAHRPSRRSVRHGVLTTTLALLDSEGAKPVARGPI